MQLAEEIRVELARQRLSVRALADMSGVPSSTVHRIVNGQGAARINDAEAIAAALGVPLWELIRRAEAAQTAA